MLDTLTFLQRKGALGLINVMDLFRNYKVKDLVWGYKDALLTLAKLMFPKQFYTDIVGIMAGVSL